MQGTTAKDKTTVKGLLPQLSSPNINSFQTVHSRWWAWTTVWLIHFTNIAPKSRGRFTRRRFVLPLPWQTVPVRKMFGNFSHHTETYWITWQRCCLSPRYPTPTSQRSENKSAFVATTLLVERHEDARHICSITSTKLWTYVYKTQLVSKRSSQWQH